MKFQFNKIIALVVLLGMVITTNAQETPFEVEDSTAKRLFVGGSMFGGMQTNGIVQDNWANGYLNNYNTSISSVAQEQGSHVGFNLNVGYFFGKNKNFGIATGVQFLQLKNTFSVDEFDVTYQSTDVFDNTFRQMILSKEKISEQLTHTVWGLPLMLTYKRNLVKNWGFTADAGVVFNLFAEANYTSQGAFFDYEAAYSFDENGNAVYDANSTSWLITQDRFETSNPNGDVDAYFEDMYEQGYNVGLGVDANNDGPVERFTVSTSWFIRPGISYQLSPNLVLSGSVAYQQMVATYNQQPNYMLTDKRGDYQSMTNGIERVSYGLMQVDLGVRYYFGKSKKVTPPEPVVEETVEIEPEEEIEVAEVEEEEPIEEEEEEIIEEVVAPVVPEKQNNLMVKVQNKANNNTIPGKVLIKKGETIVFDETVTPSGAGLILEPGVYTLISNTVGYFNTEETITINDSEALQTVHLKLTKIEQGISLNLEDINFELGGAQLAPTSFSELDRIAAKLKDNPKMVIEVAGHTDNTGNYEFNVNLSNQRAESVVNYLISKGVSPTQLKAKGYGPQKPIDTNATEEGRAKNRRVEIIVLEFDK